MLKAKIASKSNIPVSIVSNFPWVHAAKLPRRSMLHMLSVLHKPVTKD